jgi:hypothetical protein
MRSCAPSRRPANCRWRALQDAAGSSQFFGVDPLKSGSSEAKAYVHKLDQLPREQRDNLLRLIDTLVPPPAPGE